MVYNVIMDYNWSYWKSADKASIFISDIKVDSVLTLNNLEDRVR